ncbi:MAG: class I SAM-dependent methyltransferase [bacterium]|nr:class I SAM-dependent methyltransferase [bacterium]
MDLTNYTEKNREAWNEVAPLHHKAQNIKFRDLFKDKNYSVLDEVSKKILRKLQVKDKNIAHVCCNNGIELISAVRIGAERGTGFDISDAFIKEAEELAQIAGVNCNFVRTDIYELDEKYFNKFDIVLITIGALSWFDDLNKFFSKVSGLLKENGNLFIYEAHPLLNMIPCEGEIGFDKDNILKCHYSYFSKEPWIENTGIDYLGGTTYEAKTSIDFSHTLSEIINGVIKNGMNISEFNEYPHDIGVWGWLEKAQIIPLSFSLIADKNRHR